MPAVKYSGGAMMLWARFSSQRPEKLVRMLYIQIINKINNTFQKTHFLAVN